MEATKEKRAEGKFRTTEDVKRRATDVYARWGLSLSDAINVFLVKSIDVGGLPFEMTAPKLDLDELAKRAYKATLDANGVAVLPSSWAEDDE